MQHVAIKPGFHYDMHYDHHVRAFVFAAPKLWNALPRFIRETNSIDSFKRQLKTYLFKKAFCTT